MHIETIKVHGTKEPKSTLSVELELSCMDPILDYLTIGALPGDKFVARKVTRQVPRYVLYNGKLYKRSFILPLLKCLPPSDMDYVLREVHEGIYGNHLDGWALTYKILRQGYYWLAIHEDAIEYIKRYDAC